MRQTIGLFAGPLFTVLMLLSDAPTGMSEAAWRTAAAGVLMATWWITEAIPIPATALIPLALFPVLGILPMGKAAAPYANPVIFLFMGGFMIARAMESSQLHRRIAFSIIGLVGTRPRNLVGGFLVATALLSMWVSNTATAVMMLPMAASIIRFREDRGTSSPNFSVALLLAVAYGASIGGIATLIGTPPNALLAGFMSESYGVEIGFAQWMLLGVPLVLISLPLTWIILVRFVFPVPDDTAEDAAHPMSEQRESLGGISAHEKVVAAITLLVAAAWIFQPLLSRALPLSDAGIAIIGALLLFLAPVHWKTRKFALTWQDAEKLPWSVLILFGGGLSLASAVEETGLARWIGESLSVLKGLPPIVLVLVVTTLVIFLTELTSNTATAATFLPIVGSLAVGLGLNPMTLAVPAALAASCAFMLPVATPPNAIVYGLGKMTIPQMAKAGLWLNLVFIVLITLATMTLGQWLW